jgi:hypothetical protein
VAPDFQKVNVFWLARGTENDAEVERILKRSAGKLHHELSELRVMGAVPYIEFVKGTYYFVIHKGTWLIVTICLAPILQYNSGPSSKFLLRILGVDSALFLCSTQFYYASYHVNLVEIFVTIPFQ